METATAATAATVSTIVPASNATTAVITATNASNVNQSDGNSRTQISSVGSASVGSSSTGNGKSNSSNIISSNSNSSSSSCSTSSNSSGYGSTTTTPTNNYETHHQQHTPTPIRTPSTPVATATEPVIPVATVAAVTPYYNEAITTHNLEIQHQQQQQQYHHHQQQQQQQQQHHLQQSFQHHQYLQRQPYYSPYDYQQQTAPNLSSPTTYNLSSGIPYDISSQTAAVSGAYVAGQYKSSSLSAINYERNAAASRPLTAASSLYTHQEESKTVQNLQLHQAHQQQYAKQRSSASLITSSSNTTGSKPQAAATPFYAQPLSQHSNPATFYDNLKHKIPLEYHDTYANPSSAATYHQQQKYYAAAKSQLKETTYGSPTLSSKSLYPNTTNFYSGSTVNHGGYDKYPVYPHAAANAYSATGHLTNETPPDSSSYRKTAVANTLSSPTWPWGIEYASGNSRTIPPPNTHLPTATVAPTHATYLTSNPSALTRDPYYMHHDKFNVKNYKYPAAACPPSYQQTYVSPPPATRHHMWPSSHGPQLTQHHLATGPIAPPLPHTPYFSSSSGSSSLNPRQSSFSQPYQPQSCYYPSPNRLPLNQAAPLPSAQSAAYMTGQQTTAQQSSHLNSLSSSCKYGGVMTENVNKLKNPNDLYVAPHYDINNAAFNYGYGSNQIFNPNAHQSLNHAHPSPAFTHEPLAVNPASYVNDLNLTSSNYNNYPAHHYDSHLTAAPPQQQPPQYAPTVAKRALLDYRKPIQPQPPPTIGQEECYPALTTTAARLDQYNQDLLNINETPSAFAEYEVNQEVARITHNATSEAIRESEKANEEENKNLSLRDFIANWNDDEDEYNNTEDLNFEQTAAVINEVLQATPNKPETQPCEIEQPKTFDVFKSVSLKESPKSTDSFTTDVLNEVDAGPYVNLPDIIIDIEKSNNANNAIASPLSTSTAAPLEEVENNPSLILSNFDVEKELDQLKMQKDEEKLESTKDINVIKETSIITPQLSPCKAITSQLSFEDLNLEQPTKTVTTSLTIHPMTSQSSTTDTTTEQYFKDIEGYESGNSRHSNESAFEKEYETFIHKITSESAAKPTSDSVKASPETESDFEQNVQDFSKFYKRKRKLKEDELKSLSIVNQSTKKLKSNSIDIVNTSNFPKVYTKKSRNRQSKVKQQLPRKRRPLSAYYKIIHSLRRYRLFRIKHVRDHITELKEKHLPLIKRQSIKNYSHAKQDRRFNPNSLKSLSIMAINTEEFRQRLMLDIGTTSVVDNLKSEEKHLCIDPTCETCEVIKSLMEPESFQESLQLYEIPENHETTVSLLPEVIMEDVEQIVELTNESNFETQIVDSAALFKVLVAEKSELLTTSNESSLSPLQEVCFLISDKSEHQISNQTHLSEISNNSLNNAEEIKPGYSKSPTSPEFESSLESKYLLSPQRDDLEISKDCKDQIDNENPSNSRASSKNLINWEVVPEKMEKDEAINVEKLENSNIDDNLLDKAMNLKNNKNCCEDLIKVLELELPNQSENQYGPFPNSLICLKSFEDSNVNEDIIESDVSSNFKKESQSREKCVTETKPEDIRASSNFEDNKDTDDNKKDSAINTNSTESIKLNITDEKDDSESSDSDSSESDSESSSDSSDDSSDDKESRQINSDTDSSSDSDSETEDENSTDENINQNAVRENIVDSTKEISRKSPMQLHDTNSETKEENISQLTENENLIIKITAIKDSKQSLELQNDSDSECDENSETKEQNTKYNSQFTENLIQILKEPVTAIKDSKQPLELQSDSDSEWDEHSEMKEKITKNISQLTENENLIPIPKGSTEPESVTVIKDSKQLSEYQNDWDSERDETSDPKEKNTKHISQLTENVIQISKASTDSDSVTKQPLELQNNSDSEWDENSETKEKITKNISQLTENKNLIQIPKGSTKPESVTATTDTKQPLELQNDSDSEWEENSETEEQNTKIISQLTENVLQISKASTDSESVTKQPLKLQNNSDSEWDDESDDENVEISSESETQSSCNSNSSVVKLTKDEPKLNTIKLFKQAKNLQLSNNNSRLSQPNNDNISVRIIENKIGANKILIKFSTPLVKEESKVKESETDSNSEYNSETDDDDIDMECNTKWKSVNDSSQVLRASQTLLQNTLEFLHTSESSKHESCVSQTTRQMPLDFLKFAKDPEESKSDSIVISDDETIEEPENSDDLPKENLQSFRDSQKSKADLIDICDDECNGIAENAKTKESVSIKIPENLECHTNISEEAHDKLTKEYINESVNSWVDNLNENDGEPQLLSVDLEDLANNSTICKDEVTPVSVEDNDIITSEILSNNSSVVNKNSESIIPVSVEDNATMTSENLSIVNKVEIQDLSCKEKTIENELINASRNKIPTKDLSTSEELKQTEKENSVIDLSLPSASNEYISEEIIPDFKQNEDVAEILTQETTDESSICSVDSERVKSVTETCESLEEQNKDDITEEASSNEKNVVEYNFSDESDNSSDSLITSNIKEKEYLDVSIPHKQCSVNMAIKNEDEVTKTIPDCTDEDKDHSPLKESDTTENINESNDEPREEHNIENEEMSHLCADESPRSPDYVVASLENESYADDKLKYISDNSIISESSTSAEMNSVTLKSDYEKENFESTVNQKVTDNLMEIDEITKTTNESSLRNIEITEKIISSNMIEEPQTAFHRFEENIQISKSDSDVSNDDNSNNSETTEYLYRSKAISKFAVESLDTNEYSSESAVDEPMLHKSVSESTIREEENEENVSENRISDIMDEESKQKDTIFEYTTNKNSEQNYSNLELSVDESEKEFKISKPDNQVSKQEPSMELKETCLESTIGERTLYNESNRNNINSETKRDYEISEILAMEFNENETPREISEKESELIIDISEPPSNSCEGNIIEATCSILNSEHEIELYESSITDQYLNNESEQSNKNSEPLRDDEISETLAKNINENETTREIMNEESELIPDISETPSNSCEENITNAASSILDSEHETELQETNDDRTLCNESDRNNRNSLPTKDDKFDETTRETMDEESELIDINSESSSNSCRDESNILVPTQESSINKPALTETCSKSIIDDRILSKDSDPNNTTSESSRDDEICKTLAKEFHLNETTKGQTLLETHTEIVDSFSKSKTLEILTTDSKLNETSTKNISSEIQNEEPELIESRTVDIISETKESGLSTTALLLSPYEKLDNGNEVNSNNKIDSEGEILENIQPNLIDTITDKETITEDLSEDFYGFKNQSSFEDESGDFHGFEDIEEERRIRREIENLNEDSAANDGFLNSTLNKESYTSSKTSLAGSTTSELNELEALEKELSQHQVDGKHPENDDIETDINLINPTNKIISTNDIEHIKQMLESDEEPQQDETEYQDERNAINSNKDVSDLTDRSSKEILNNKSFVIPKLSVLCRAALNSSLHVNNLTIVQTNPDQLHNDDNSPPTTVVEREVTVEEALAEMYRQAGVLLSDPEDCDNDTAKTTTYYNEEAQDVLLFNLQEILNSDNDIYVLQCDMNEKILNVVEQTNSNDVNDVSLEENTERVNTLQFIGILDTENSQTHIHILSSDSESEVIILSDDDAESVYEPLPLPERHEPRITIPFINDSDFNNDSLSDISTIHHEEIVPDNLNKFLQEEFYKYLHEKYVQRNISKYFYANRILKKYKNRFVKKSRQ